MDENFSLLDPLVDSGALTEEEFQAQKGSPLGERMTENHAVIGLGLMSLPSR
jgi:hypothetical protein